MCAARAAVYVNVLQYPVGKGAGQPGAQIAARNFRTDLDRARWCVRVVMEP
jgi:hypothetical protein